MNIKLYGITSENSWEISIANAEHQSDSKTTNYFYILNINSNPCFLLSRSLHLVVNPELQFIEYKTDCTWARPCNNRKYFHSTQVMIFAIR